MNNSLLENGQLIIRKSFSRQEYSVTKIKCYPECKSSEADKGQDMNKEMIRKIELNFTDQEYGIIVLVESFKRNLMDSDEDELIFYNEQDQVSDLIYSAINSTYEPKVEHSLASAIIYDIQSYFGTKGQLNMMLGNKTQKSLGVYDEIKFYNSLIDKPIKNYNYNISLSYSSVQNELFSFKGFVKSSLRTISINDSDINMILECYENPSSQSISNVFELPQIVSYPLYISSRVSSVYDMAIDIGPYVGRGKISYRNLYDTVEKTFEYLGPGVIKKIEVNNINNVPFSLTEAIVASRGRRYSFLLLFNDLPSHIENKQVNIYDYIQIEEEEGHTIPQLLMMYMDKIYRFNKIIKINYQKFISIDINSFINVLDPDNKANLYYKSIQRISHLLMNEEFFKGRDVLIPLSPTMNSQNAFIDRYLSAFGIKTGSGNDILNNLLNLGYFILSGRQILDFRSFAELNQITSARRVPYYITDFKEVGCVEETQIKYKYKESDVLSLNIGSYARGTYTDELGFVSYRNTISPNTKIDKENVIIITQPKAPVNFIFDKSGDQKDPKIFTTGIINVNLSNIYFNTVEGFKDFCINYLNRLTNYTAKTISGNGPLLDEVLDNFINISSVTLDYLGPSYSVSGI